MSAHQFLMEAAGFMEMMAQVIEAREMAHELSKRIAAIELGSDADEQEIAKLASIILEKLIDDPKIKKAKKDFQDKYMQKLGDFMQREAGKDDEATKRE